LFALHPAHIESVAWISERKDVLSTFFGLLALIGYVNWTKRKQYLGLGLALVCYALSLLAKGMLVTLPFVLLLLDFWPLQRMENPGLRTFLKPEFRRLVFEKWPWFFLSFAMSAVTYWAQSTWGAVINVQVYGLPFRLANAATAYCCYVGEMFWPFNLAVYYPLPRYRLILPLISACIVLGAVSLMVVAVARKKPFLLTGWCWFLGTLVPVIGIVQVGSQSMADRYTYVPYLGLFIAAVWLLAEAFERAALSQKLIRGLAAAVLVVCAASTWWQLGYWQNSLTLFTRDVEVTGGNSIALNNIGAGYLEKGEDDRAIQYFRDALSFDPGDVLARGNLGKLLFFNGDPSGSLENMAVALRIQPTNATYHLLYADALAKLGYRETALEHFRTALRYNGNLVQAYSDMGLTLVELGRVEEGITNLQYAISRETNFVDAYNNLGTALAKQGKLAEAIRTYEQAVKISPTNAAAHYNLGLAKDKEGSPEAAMEHFQSAVSLDKKHADARSQLGRHLFMRGRMEDAARVLQDAVRLKPDLPQAQIYLGLSLFEIGKEREAIPHIQTASRLVPDSLEVVNAMAWMMATANDDAVRNGSEAVVLSEKAAMLTRTNQPVILHTLAAAYAEAGRFSDAISTAETAVGQANTRGQTNLVTTLQKAMAGYRERQAWRHNMH
jgi:tetratricopeptide (TPR) repeat protein